MTTADRRLEYPTSGNLWKTCPNGLAIESIVRSFLHPLFVFRHNAGIYGVAERISFVHDDFAHFAEHYTGPKIDAVFLSPPWGGPGHLDCPHFSLRDVEAGVFFS